MPRTKPPYPEEFRRQMVALVRSGRSPYELAKQFEPTAATISKWVKQADLDEGRRAYVSHNCREKRNSSRA